MVLLGVLAQEPHPPLELRLAGSMLGERLPSATCEPRSLASRTSASWSTEPAAAITMLCGA